MEAPLIASAVTTAITLYILRSQDSQTKIGISAAVGLWSYYATSRTLGKISKTVRYVGIEPRTNCPYHDVSHSGEAYACAM